eukprot:364321-Chlamydomonas_euryale.AAC.4
MSDGLIGCLSNDLPRLNSLPKVAVMSECGWLSVGCPCLFNDGMAAAVLACEAAATPRGSSLPRGLAACHDGSGPAMSTHDGISDVAERVGGWLCALGALAKCSKPTPCPGVGRGC